MDRRGKQHDGDRGHLAAGMSAARRGPHNDNRWGTQASEPRLRPSLSESLECDVRAGVWGRRCVQHEEAPKEASKRCQKGKTYANLALTAMGAALARLTTVYHLRLW